MRGVVLVLPCDYVRSFLPAGLDLGPQLVTPQGTHPVLFFFNDIFRAYLSLPTLVPGMTYHELHIGIPFVCISSGPLSSEMAGPYYFMPKLYLDQLLPILGGILFWGFRKEMASVVVTANSYTVIDVTGRRVASLTWKTEAHGGYGKLSEFPYFQVIQQMLSQTLISQVPCSVGPLFALSVFAKKWDAACLRPLETLLDTELVNVAAKSPLLAPEWSPGIDLVALGSYELRVPWELSLPYPPPRSIGR